MAEGANALLRSNGMGHHWEGLYNTGLVETLGRARRAQANDLPPTVKMVLLIGSYVAERYHRRLYAKAQNLRRVLRGGYDRALQDVDVLAMPTTLMTAHRYEPDIDIAGLLTHGWDMFNNTAPGRFSQGTVKCSPIQTSSNPIKPQFVGQNDSVHILVDSPWQPFGGMVHRHHEESEVHHSLLGVFWD